MGGDDRDLLARNRRLLVDVTHVAASLDPVRARDAGCPGHATAVDVQRTNFDCHAVLDLVVDPGLDPLPARGRIHPEDRGCLRQLLSGTVGVVNIQSRLEGGNDCVRRRRVFGLRVYRRRRSCQQQRDRRQRSAK